MRTLKIAASALALCAFLGGTVTAAVFPSMPKAHHSTRAAHTHGANHSYKHK